jgi:hypothetical protein
MSRLGGPERGGNLLARTLGRFFKGNQTPSTESITQSPPNNEGGRATTSAVVVPPDEKPGKPLLNHDGVVGESQSIQKELKSNGEYLILAVGPISGSLITESSPKYLEGGTKVVVNTVISGREAVSLYQEFRKISPTKRVVLVVDEELTDPDDRYKDGVQVAQLVIQTSENMGWDKPQVMGIETQKRDIMNDRTQPLSFRLMDVADDDYLGTIPARFFSRFESNVFDALNEGVTLDEIRHREYRMKEKERMQAFNAKLQKRFEPQLDILEKSNNSGLSRKAKAAWDELRQKSEKRVFCLIIDDDREKTESIQKSLARELSEAKVDFVITSELDGNHGIVLYEEFAKLAPNEKTIVFMDGYLGGDDSGQLVTERLLWAAQRLQLPTPMVVGTSSDKEKNADTKEAAQENNPELYLGNFYGNDRWEEALSRII